MLLMQILPGRRDRHMKRILIVEDDREIRGILRDFLEQNEYEVVEARDGIEASRKMADEDFSLILMDMMLPFKSGDTLISELCASEKPGRSVPVIVISARSSKDIRLEVMRMGADDYIIKPFDLDEVLVRMEVLLRRADEAEMASVNERLEYKGVIFDKELGTVTYGGSEIKLTAKEMQLLKLFLENPRKTFSKAGLYESVWNEDYIYEDNTINVHMSNLRKKLRNAAGEEIIETVWGIGYRLKDRE